MLSIITSVVVVAVVAFVTFAWKFIDWVWLRPRKIEKLFRQQGMKGNSYRFLIGDSVETGEMYDKAYSKPIGFHDDITPRVMPNIFNNVQKYGNYSFSWSGPRPRLFIMDTGAAREVLSKHRSYGKTFKIASHALKLLFSGLASLEGDEWAKVRGKLNPVFSVDKLKPMVPAFQLSTEETLSKWREMVSKEGGSGVVDVCHDLNTFTCEVFSQVMFTAPYTDDIKRTFLELGELSNMAKLPSKILNIPGEEYLPTRTNRRGREINRHVRAVFTSMIRERLNTCKEKRASKQDLLDVLMEDLYDGKTTTWENDVEGVIGNCKLFFFAGSETSASLLTWTILMLAYRQDWQARARDEVLQVFGDKKKLEITNEDLGKLKTVGMILNEMLRLYPPGMEITRLVNEDIKVKDYTVPAGTLLTFPVLMFHRSKEIWGEDALEFNPERFAQGVTKAATKAGEVAFMPFGWGPRNCVGLNFAMLEMKTFLAMLLREFKIDFSQTYTHAPAVAITINPQFGAPVVLTSL